MLVGKDIVLLMLAPKAVPTTTQYAAVTKAPTTTAPRWGTKDAQCQTMVQIFLEKAKKEYVGPTNMGEGAGRKKSQTHIIRGGGLTGEERGWAAVMGMKVAQRVADPHIFF